MGRLEGLADRLAFAASAVDQTPDKLDLDRIQDVAAAIGRMTPAQRERLADLATHGRAALFAEVVTVNHIVNDLRRERVDKRGGQYFEAFLNPDDVLRGLRFYLVKEGVKRLGGPARDELAAKIEVGDSSAMSALLGDVGLDAGASNWVTRVAKGGLLDVRAKPAEQIAALEASLEETLAGTGGGLRHRAADLFAALLNQTMLLGKREQKLRPNLAGWFDRLASFGAPGFLPAKTTFSHDVPLAGGAVGTEHRFSPEIRTVGLMLQLGRIGDGLDYEKPGGGTVIRVGDDEAHLGSPGAPLGIVTDDGHVVVPMAVEALIFEKTMGDHERQLGFGELPSGRFRLGTRLLGASLRLPVSVDVGGARFTLKHGTYVSGAKDAEVVPGRPITLSANGVTKRVDPSTGEVS